MKIQSVSMGVMQIMFLGAVLMIQFIRLIDKVFLASVNKVACIAQYWPPVQRNLYSRQVEVLV